MAEDWDAVAADVSAALAEVGFAATLHAPGTNTGTEADPVWGAETDYTANILVDVSRRRDQTGMVTGLTQTVTVAVFDAVPQKGWGVTIRGIRHRIAEVQTLAPGGVDLLYDLILEG